MFSTLLVVVLLIAAVVCAILALKKGKGRCGSFCGDFAQCGRSPQDCEK